MSELFSDKTIIWHQKQSSEVANTLDVNPAQGLSEVDVAQRIEQFGPNSITETKKEPT